MATIIGMFHLMVILTGVGGIIIIVPTVVFTLLGVIADTTTGMVMARVVIMGDLV